MHSVRSRWRRKATLRNFLFVFVTTYLTLLGIFSGFVIFPSSNSSENNKLNHRSNAKLHDVQGWEGEWHSSSKRGARPRNVLFSNEGHDDELKTLALLPENLSRQLVPPATISNDSNKVVTLENNFRQTELSDIFIGIKTTEKYHNSRLPVLFETWLEKHAVREQTYFFTDKDDSKFYQLTNGHFINTHCVDKHTREGLCCKTGAMFSVYLQSSKRWWCSMDDDNYLNINNLLKFLRYFHHDKDYYFGRSSTSREIVVFDKGDEANRSGKTSTRQAHFWFATGGAGVCISRSLALKMTPYASIGEFPKVCKRISLPDDVSLGFVIVDLLGMNLTKVMDLHSHLQPLTGLKEHQIDKAITLSYISKNHVKLKSAVFNSTNDPTMFKSIHCRLNPEASICPDV